MNKKLFLLFMLTFTMAENMMGQDRVNRVLENFTFISEKVERFAKWDRNSDGQWIPFMSGLYKGPKRSNYIGAFNWDIISFNTGDNNVYALRFTVGSYFFEYPSLEMGAIYSKDHIFYFITLDDIHKINNLVNEEILVIEPYAHYDYDFGEDDTIRRYKSGNIKRCEDERMLIKLTSQNDEKVVRFTLPYENYGRASIFETGPYYEIKLSRFKRFIKSLKPIL